MTRRIAKAAALLALLTLRPAPAAAANKDMERLQLQVATLQSMLGDIQRSVEDGRKEVQRLNEVIAAQNALLQKATTDRRAQDEANATTLRELDDRISELAEAIQALRASAIIAPPPGPAQPASTPGPAVGAAGPNAAPAATVESGSGPVNPTTPVGPPPAPRELYSQAYADYARGNYDLAIQGFQEYIRNYPNTDFTDNAQYWIGESLYGKKMYAEAIEAWNALFRDYPSSDKLPDARVKKGMALERLGRRSQALVEYRYVIDRFPNTQAARIAREHLNP
ncbi:MAG TPA: tol-pal system protein YbgF [Vicinamibacteria bacterium]|nr:tol-pal system protein YbgF [Vicinamibacteria bacterium]